MGVVNKSIAACRLPKALNNDTAVISMEQMNLAITPTINLDRAAVTDAQSQTDPQENEQKNAKDCSQTIIRPEPGACGEHQPLPVTEHELGMKPISQLRVPCPYDPKHTCFASPRHK